MSHLRKFSDEYKADGMTGSVHNISTAFDDANEYLNTLVAEAMLSARTPHIWTEFRADRVVPPALLDGATASTSDRTNERYLFLNETGILLIVARKTDGRVWCTSMGVTPEAARQAAEDFFEKLEPFAGAVVPEGQVRINFWNQTARGPARRQRKLDMPTWAEIRGNYNTSTASAVDEFMSMKEWDDSRGKLVIWRGDPGLGKTYALRAMCDNWNTWASIHYVIDPEQFLSDPDYLYSVMGFDEDEMPGSFADLMEDLEDAPKKKNPISHRLIILEDAGELVGAEARHETGQALSRLLNAVDGMFGQGTKCVLMITTNEEKGKLHPAVGRPGRCAKDVTFQTFDVSQAEEWLAANGGNPLDARKDMTLSDLYAAKHEHTNTAGQESDKPIGFAMA